MDSKSIPRDSLTLLFAVLLGSGVAAILRRDVPAGPAGDPAAAHFGSDALTASPPAALHSSARPSPEAIACASAWESLKEGRLTHTRRIQAQLALLGEWSRLDPAAALIAFFSEVPVGEAGSFDLMDFDSLPVMAANPELVEGLLTSGRLGLRTNFLRFVWFRHLAEEDPLGTFDRLGELPGERRNLVFEAVAQALPSISEDPVTWQAGMKRISALISRPVKEVETQSIVKGLGSGTSLGDLNAAYLATEDADLRDLFVRAARESARGDDPFANEPVIPAEFHDLSEPFRSAVIGKLKKSSTAADPPPPIPEE
jgi:hypothetical protein